VSTETGTGTELLFFRKVRNSRPTGGNIKVRDYFLHAMAHPLIGPRFFFAPESLHKGNDLWDEIPECRRIKSFDPAKARFIFINGKDWSLLPEDLAQSQIIHLIQHGGHAADLTLRRYLARPAWRVCTSETLRELIAPLANGPVIVAPLGIADAFFTGRAAPKVRQVTIAGVSNRTSPLDCPAS
jgi:hypothetical protein